MLFVVRLKALFEGTSLILLVFIAVPLKHIFGMPEAISVIGPIHGVLFLLFNTALFIFAGMGNLSGVKAFLGFFASFVPFGTFVYDAKVLKPIAIERAKQDL